MISVSRLPAGDRLRLAVTANSYLGLADGRLPPDRSAARRAALRRSLGAVIEDLLTRDAALLIQAGNLFGIPDPPEADRIFAAGELARLNAAGRPVVAVPGRRELLPGGKGERWDPRATFARLGALTLLADPARVSTALFAWGERTVAIGGLGWNPALGPADDPLGEIAWRPDAALRILVLPYAVVGRGAAGEPAVPRETLERLEGVHLVIAGGAADPEIIRLPGCTIVLTGATERPDFDTPAAEPGYWSIDLDGAGAVLATERRPVPVQPHHEVIVSTEDLATDDPAVTLRERVWPVLDPAALIRVRLSGPLDRALYQALDLWRLSTEGTARAFSFDLVVDGPFQGADSLPAVGRGGRLSPAEAVARAAADLAATDADPLWAVARDRILTALGTPAPGDPRDPAP